MSGSYSPVRHCGSWWGCVAIALALTAVVSQAQPPENRLGRTGATSRVVLSAAEAEAAWKKSHPRVWTPGAYKEVKVEMKNETRITTTRYEWREAENGGRRRFRTEIAMQNQKSGTTEIVATVLRDPEGSWEVFPRLKIALLRQSPFDPAASLGRMKAVVDERGGRERMQTAEYRTFSGERIGSGDDAVVSISLIYGEKTRELMEPELKKVLGEMKRMVDAELKKQPLAVRMLAKPILLAKWPSVAEILPARVEKEIQETTGVVLVERTYNAAGKKISEHAVEALESCPELTLEFFLMSDLQRIRPASTAEHTELRKRYRKEEREKSGGAHSEEGQKVDAAEAP